MAIINARFLQARHRAHRLAAQTGAPGLAVPAYVRKNLCPRVQIGILRDPAQPIVIQPAVHVPARRSGIDTTLGGVCGVLIVGVLVALALGA